jgi:hypothetical protein
MGEFPLKTLLAILKTGHLACASFEPVDSRQIPQKSWGNAAFAGARDSAQSPGNQPMRGN